MIDNFTSVLCNSLLGCYILKSSLLLCKFQEEASVLIVSKLSYSKQYSKSSNEAFIECLFLDLNPRVFKKQEKNIATFVP